METAPPSLGPAPESNCPCGEILFLISNWNFPCVPLSLILSLGTSQESLAPASLQTRIRQLLAVVRAPFAAFPFPGCTNPLLSASAPDVLQHTSSPTARPELQGISGECWSPLVSILPSQGCHQGGQEVPVASPEQQTPAYLGNVEKKRLTTTLRPVGAVFVQVFDPCSGW